MKRDREKKERRGEERREGVGLNRRISRSAEPGFRLR